MNCKRFASFGCLLMSLAISAVAQDINNHSLLHCETPERLTFQQRACLYENRLLAPSGLAQAVFLSGLEQWRNSPHMRGDEGSEFAHRFEVFYAKRAAQNTGEFLAGYLNHEDPRYHSSNLHGGWNRTRAALRSVVVVDGENGARPALAPIAGSFGAGFVGVACYRVHNSVDDGFRRTGVSYGGYFATAILREFAPDLTVKANHMFHRHSQE